MLAQPTKRKKTEEKGKGPHVHLSTKNKPQSELAHITGVYQTNENKLLPSHYPC